MNEGQLSSVIDIISKMGTTSSASGRKEGRSSYSFINTIIAVTPLFCIQLEVMS